MKVLSGKLAAFLLLGNSAVVKAQPRSPNAPRPIAPRKPAAPVPKPVAPFKPNAAAPVPKPVAPFKPNAAAPKPVAPAPGSACPATVPYTQPPAAQCANCHKNMSALTEYLNGASNNVSATVCSGKYAWPSTAAVDNANITSLTLSCCGNAKSCIIDGGAPKVTRIRRLFTFVNPIKNLDIQGITFQNVNCSDNYNDNYYGACEGALLATLSTALVTFKHNTVSKVTSADGALSIERPSLVFVEDCDFIDNTAAVRYYGSVACISCHSSTVTMNGNTFLRNSAYTSGAVYFYDSDVVANCNKFEGNKAIEPPNVYYGADAGDKSVDAGEVNFWQGGGGAIRLSSSSLDAKLNVFINNTGASGGAIYANYYSHINAKLNTFTFNNASNGGGGAIFGNNAVVVINADTFVKNADTLDGDNFYLDESTVLTTCNSTLVGVHVGISSLSLVSCF